MVVCLSLYLFTYLFLLPCAFMLESCSCFGQATRFLVEEQQSPLLGLCCSSAQCFTEACHSCPGTLKVSVCVGSLGLKGHNVTKAIGLDQSALLWRADLCEDRSPRPLHPGGCITEAEILLPGFTEVLGAKP